MNTTEQFEALRQIMGYKIAPIKICKNCRFRQKGGVQGQINICHYAENLLTFTVDLDATCDKFEEKKA